MSVLIGPGAQAPDEVPTPEEPVWAPELNLWEESDLERAERLQRWYDPDWEALTSYEHAEPPVAVPDVVSITRAVADFRAADEQVRELVAADFEAAQREGWPAKPKGWSVTAQETRLAQLCAAKKTAFTVLTDNGTADLVGLLVDEAFHRLRVERDTALDLPRPDEVAALSQAGAALEQRLTELRGGG